MKIMGEVNFKKAREDPWNPPENILIFYYSNNQSNSCIEATLKFNRVRADPAALCAGMQI